MELECTVDAQDAVVLDIGTGCIKAGYCGEDMPRSVVPTVCAARLDGAGGGSQGRSMLWGHEAYLYGTETVPLSLNSGGAVPGGGGTAGALGGGAAGFDLPPGAAAATGGGSPIDDGGLGGLGDGGSPGGGASTKRWSNKIYPVQRGLFQRTSESEECLELLLENTLRGLHADEDLPVLVLDMPLNPISNREWMVEYLFEKCRVPSVAIFNTAVMSLFSTGRTRGLVVESGEGVTHAVPVFEGFAIPHAIFSMDIAGQDITQELTKRVLDAGIVGDKPSVVTMQKMKERLGTVAANREEACSFEDDIHRANTNDGNNKPQSADDEEARSFELPDGTIIQVPAHVRRSACEILFNNSRDRNAKECNEGVEDKGETHNHNNAPTSIQSICLKAMQTCDVSFRNDLVRSVVVAGGTSMLKGFAPRLQLELQALVPPDMEKQVNVLVDSQRRHAAWIGGSMFASLSTFKEMVVTRAEYDEGKADMKSLVWRKTF